MLPTFALNSLAVQVDGVENEFGPPFTATKMSGSPSATPTGYGTAIVVDDAGVKGVAGKLPTEPNAMAI